MNGWNRSSNLFFVQLAGAWKYGLYRSNASLCENIGGNCNGISGSCLMNDFEVELIIIIFYSLGQEDDPSWYYRASNSISEISESVVDTHVNVSPLRITGWSLFSFLPCCIFYLRTMNYFYMFLVTLMFFAGNIISKYISELMSLLIVPKDLLFSLVCAWPLLHNVNYFCGIRIRYQCHMT